MTTNPQRADFALQLPKTLRNLLPQLNYVEPKYILLRDGELVVYRRERSQRFQCRYKLSDGTWHRQSTGKASLEHAISRACDIYDEARYRLRLGLAHKTHSVAQIARETAADLRRQMRVSGILCKRGEC